jgi:hypothetical protein
LVAPDVLEKNLETVGGLPSGKKAIVARAGGGSSRVRPLMSGEGGTGGPSADPLLDYWTVRVTAVE